MARNKKGKTGGKSRGKEKKKGQNSPPNPRNFVPASRSRQPQEDQRTPTFTLRDVAFNSEHRSSMWSSGVNLRHKAIGFVRSSEQQEQENIQSREEFRGAPSGDVPRQEEEQEKIEGSQPTPKHNNGRQSNQSFPKFDDVLHTLDSTISRSSVAYAKPSSHEGPNAVKKRSNTAKSSPAQQAHSPTPSTSSDEVVFAGRNAYMKINAADGGPKNLNGRRTKVSSPQANPPVSNAQTKPVQPTKPAWDNSMDNWVHRSERVKKQQSPAATLEQVSRRQSPKRRKTVGNEPSLDQAIIQDYIDNMNKSGTIKDQFPEAAERPEKQANTDLNGWTRETLQDFDDLSTSEEVLDVVSQVLSKRQRPSGFQYLVVWDGQSVDEARWTPLAALTMPGADEMINAFEEQESMIPEYTQFSDDTNEETADGEDEDEWLDEDEDEEADEDLEDELNEADLIARKQESMTDERIARLLSKQEELGMGSDDIVIFDDDEDMEDEDKLATPAAKRTRRGCGGKKRGHDKTQRRDPVFDVAEDVLNGDDYGGFDVMDWEGARVSASRGRRDDVATFGLSDPDLERTLRDSFAMDRKKKKAKKQEREELRAQGFLPKKGKSKANSGVSFVEGIDLEQIRDDLEDFLESHSQQLALPPMDKKERKVVHEISGAFQLKSKSSGSGRNRYPVLYKTKHTRGFEDFTFNRISKKWAPRLKAEALKSGKRFAGSNRNPRAGYADGEVVGGAAPELGSDNRGRALLEKMGWSKGLALGAEHNKGRLQPVEHVIKKGRTGLG